MDSDKKGEGRIVSLFGSFVRPTISSLRTPALPLLSIREEVWLCGLTAELCLAQESTCLAVAVDNGITVKSPIAPWGFRHVQIWSVYDVHS